MTFAELQQDEAETLLKQYNEEGRKAGPPPDKRFDNRQGGFRGRGGGSFQRYDNREGSRGGYQSRSGDGGSGYRGGEWTFDSNVMIHKTVKLCISLIATLCFCSGLQSWQLQPEPLGRQQLP